MPTIKFNVLAEFITELEADHTLIDRRICRICTVYRSTSIPPVRHMYVVATAKLGEDILHFERYCGEILGLNKDQDKSAFENADTIRHRLVETCGALGLTVRYGLLEDK